jgi:hypothetical protein
MPGANQSILAKSIFGVVFTSLISSLSFDCYRPSLFTGRHSGEARTSVFVLALSRQPASIRKQQKRPARGMRVSGPFESWCALLSRRTGHSRQHAMRMMMVVTAMLHRKVHLSLS